MATRLDISQLRGRAPSRRTDSSRRWQIDHGESRGVIALELVPEAVTLDTERRERWLDALTIEARPGLAVWEVYERLDIQSSRGLGLPGPAVVAARSWVDGRSLGRRSTTTRWRDTGAAVAMSLRELHDQGLHHGALKPANVVMRGSEEVILTDLPLSPSPYDDPTRLASIAPYLAPECWEGEAVEAPADIYAFGVMLGEFATGRRPLMANGLSGWKKAHTSGAPRLDHLRELGLAGLVAEMIAKNPSKRPGADEVVQRLAKLGADVAPPSVSPLTDQIMRTATSCVERLKSPLPTHLIMRSHEQADADRRVTRLVARRLQLTGRPTVFMDASTPEAGWPWTEGTSPWSTLVELARQVSRLAGRELRDVSVRGDELHLLREFSSLILDRLPEDGLRVVWHGFDDELADVRKIWTELVDASVSRGRPLATLTVTDDPMPRAEPVGVEATAAAWDDWRRKTVRGDVRRMSSAAWRQAVSEGAPGLDAMKAALDRQLGARVDEASEPQRVGDLSSVDVLLDARAYRAAAERCARIWTSTPDDDDSRARLLDAWVEAATHLPESTDATDALEQWLSDQLRRDDSPPAFAVKLARVRLAQGRPLEAIQALNRAAPGRVEDRASVAIYKTQANLDCQRYADAVAAAAAGADVLAGQDAPAHEEQRERLHLLELAARAADARPDAADQLEATLAASDLEWRPQQRAQLYRCLGRGRTAEERFDDAIDAYLRALDIVENAGLDGQIPLHRLRLGTAYHRRGQLGLAREQYERGIDASTERTGAETRALMHAQLSAVDETLGAVDSAERHLWSARDLADAHNLDSVLVVCDMLEGGLYLRRDDPNRARECFKRALQGRRPTSSLQRAELELSVAEAELAMGDVEAARHRISSAREIVDEHSIDELRPRLMVLRGKYALAAESVPSMSAIEEYRQGLAGALARSDFRHVLRHAPDLAELLRDEGIEEPLQAVAELYAEARRSVSTGLTRKLREQFERDAGELSVDISSPAPPAERDAGRSSVTETSPATPPVQSSRDAGQFRRLLGFNEVLFGAETLVDVAEGALDVLVAMVQHDGALVLLRSDANQDAGDIVSARGGWVDGGSADRVDSLQSVAEEVATVGQSMRVEPTVDPRFGSSEELDALVVRALPIRDGRGVVGAIVLVEGESAVATRSSTQLLEAIAHQVALATRAAREREDLVARLEAAEQTRGQLEREAEAMESDLARLRERVGRGGAGRSERVPIPHVSGAMESFVSRLESVATRQMPVEMIGPDGARRTTYARLLHQMGPRRDASFVAVDCGAFAADALEVELFGEITPRFERRGALSLADGGTLFLDRVDRMSPELQARLYQALRAESVRAIGAEQAQDIDVRPVTGTLAPLNDLVEQEGVSADLAHWLSAEQLRIPPLSDRREDIPLIAAQLLDDMSSGLGRDVSFSAEAATVLRKARWPGDLRQLESVVRAAATLIDGDIIDESTVEALVEQDAARQVSATQETRGRKPKATRADVITAMQRADDDRKKAAELLDVSERTLYRYLKKYELR